MPHACTVPTLTVLQSLALPTRRGVTWVGGGAVVPTCPESLPPQQYSSPPRMPHVEWPPAETADQQSPATRVGKSRQCGPDGTPQPLGKLMLTPSSLELLWPQQDSEPWRKPQVCSAPSEIALQSDQ